VLIFGEAYFQYNNIYMAEKQNFTHTSFQYQISFSVHNFELFIYVFVCVCMYMCVYICVCICVFSYSSNSGNLGEVHKKIAPSSPTLTTVC